MIAILKICVQNLALMHIYSKIELIKEYIYKEHFRLKHA
jgi:hypothetical protein